jgi:hypothetical protein
VSSSEELLARFGETVSLFLQRANKAQHSSGMFDLRRRTVIGAYTYFDHLGWALDVLDAHEVTPEQLGAGGRGLCGEPFSAQIHGILWGQLLARENELGLGRDGGDPEQLARVIEWWARAAGAYRGGDGDALVPSEDGDRQPAAPAAQVLGAIERFGRPAAEFPEAAKTTAALQLYSYVLRGEQRGTTYYHGPYPGRGGTTLVVEEFTRMRDNELPWSAPVLPLDSVCSVLELDGVATSFDLFQGMATDPVDFRAHVRRTSLLTCDDGIPRAVTEAERTTMLEVLASEQERVFREQLGWDSDYRMAYAAYHYLDFLAPFFAAAGCGPEVMVEARERFAETVRRRLREVADTDPVPVWERLFGRSGRDLFTPLQAETESEPAGSRRG